MRRAVFPGSFDPLTVAHVGIADAVVVQRDVDVVHLAISEVALDKEHGGHATVAERTAAIDALGCDRPWIASVSTRDQLLADIADGYDVLVIGADKWHQLHEVRFYDGSARERDAALARLPELAVAPRAGVTLPAHVPVLQVEEALRHVSSTAVRAGRRDWRI
jgi:nicotinic acid mononucleotide adenylyltransferase